MKPENPLFDQQQFADAVGQQERQQQEERQQQAKLNVGFVVEACRGGYQTTTFNTVSCHYISFSSFPHAIEIANSIKLSRAAVMRWAPVAHDQFVWK